MPRTPRNPREIAVIRRKILDVSLDILLEQGFTALSMRKIAARLSMTAANIYNYFSNKDEIYLAIQTRGFEILLARFVEIEQRPLDLRIKIKAMIRAYLDFGISQPDQYEIMFTRNTPKFIDYVGTPLEAAAGIEKSTALQVAAVTTRVISDFMEKHPGPNPSDPAYRTIQLWTALHGVVSLYNSRVLQEADENPEATMERLTEELLLPFVIRKKRNQKPPGGVD